MNVFVYCKLAQPQKAINREMPNQIGVFPKQLAGR